jgi:hypothetical protein
MDSHGLKPVYTPCSWSIDPAVKESHLSPELGAQIATRITDAILGRYDAMATAAMPTTRNRVREEMGDEYVDGLDVDKLLFIAAMLKPWPN